MWNHDSSKGLCDLAGQLGYSFSQFNQHLLSDYHVLGTVLYLQLENGSKALHP